MNKQTKRKQGAQPKFTNNDDQRLKDFVSKFGIEDWTKISMLMKNKSAKQCKDRWSNYLDPAYSHSPWTEEEDNLLLLMYEEMGSQWTLMSSHFEKKTPGEIRFRYLKLMRQKMKMNRNNFHKEEEIVESRKENRRRDQRYVHLDDITENSTDLRIDTQVNDIFNQYNTVTFDSVDWVSF